jgi:hypothetical protein
MSTDIGLGVRIVGNLTHVQILDAHPIFETVPLLSQPSAPPPKPFRLTRERTVYNLMPLTTIESTSFKTPVSQESPPLGNRVTFPCIVCKEMTIKICLDTGIPYCNKKHREQGRAWLEKIVSKEIEASEEIEEKTEESSERRSFPPQVRVHSASPHRSRKRRSRNADSIKSLKHKKVDKSPRNLPVFMLKASQLDKQENTSHAIEKSNKQENSKQAIEKSNKQENTSHAIEKSNKQENSRQAIEKSDKQENQRQVIEKSEVSEVRGKEKFVEDSSEDSGLDKENLDKWEPIAIAGRNSMKREEKKKPKSTSLDLNSNLRSFTPDTTYQEDQSTWGQASFFSKEGGSRVEVKMEEVFEKTTPSTESSPEQEKKPKKSKKSRFRNVAKQFISGVRRKKKKEGETSSIPSGKSQSIDENREPFSDRVSHKTKQRAKTWTRPQTPRYRTRGS